MAYSAHPMESTVGLSVGPLLKMTTFLVEGKRYAIDVERIVEAEEDGGLLSVVVGVYRCRITHVDAEEGRVVADFVQQQVYHFSRMATMFNRHKTSHPNRMEDSAMDNIFVLAKDMLHAFSTEIYRWRQIHRKSWQNAQIQREMDGIVLRNKDTEIQSLDAQLKGIRAQLRKNSEEASARQIGLEYVVQMQKDDIKRLTKVEAALGDKNIEIQSKLDEIQAQSLKSREEASARQTELETVVKRQKEDIERLTKVETALKTKDAEIQVKLKDVQAQSLKSNEEASARQMEADKVLKRQKEDIKRLSNLEAALKAKNAEIQGKLDDMQVQSLKSREEASASQTEVEKLVKRQKEDIKKLTNLEASLKKKNVEIQGLETKLAQQQKKDNSSNSTPSSSSPSSSSPSPSSLPSKIALSTQERDLAGQLFSWMTLSLKLEAALQDRQFENFDSGSLLNKLLTDQTPWIQWPGIISEKMSGNITVKN